MKAVHEWLGHCTFNVTANYYSHIEYSLRIESVDKITRLLSGEGLDDTDKDSDNPKMTQNATSQNLPKKLRSEIESSEEGKSNGFGRKIRLTKNFYLPAALQNQRKFR